jgi:hypothetical protein
VHFDLNTSQAVAHLRLYDAFLSALFYSTQRATKVADTGGEHCGASFIPGLLPPDVNETGWSFEIYGMSAAISAPTDPPTRPTITVDGRVTATVAKATLSWGWKFPRNDGNIEAVYAGSIPVFANNKTLPSGKEAALALTKTSFLFGLALHLNQAPQDSPPKGSKGSEWGDGFVDTRSCDLDGAVACNVATGQITIPVHTEWTFQFGNHGVGPGGPPQVTGASFSVDVWIFEMTDRMASFLSSGQMFTASLFQPPRNGMYWASKFETGQLRFPYVPDYPAQICSPSSYFFAGELCPIALLPLRWEGRPYDGRGFAAIRHCPLGG